MKDKKHFRLILADVRQHLERQDFGEARAMLAALVTDPDIGALGPLTVIGLPRPLHATLLKLAKVEGDVLSKIAYQYTLVPPTNILAKHGQFSSDERSEMATANRMPVPRTIHQIWIGPNPPPVTTLAWQTHAKRHGYGYKLWREDDLRAIGVDRNLVFTSMLERGDMPGAVDVARYIVLQQLGGIYLDCDWYPAREDISFHHRLSLIGLNVIAEDIPRDTGAGSVLLSNALIAAPKGHPAISRILTALPEVLHTMPDTPAWWSTGPLLFTVVCRGGAVTIADSALVARNAAPDASLPEVEALCVKVQAEDGGLLVAWKPW
ncbi:MAG: TcdA/TcdB catalytic glycosyltransferase domain-containing protein [Albidovulum sp.]